METTKAINTNIDHYWSPELIRKYDLTGPRYTSYPTALEFSEEYSEQSWVNISSSKAREKTPTSLYIHIPFCDTICYYCGCNKVVTANRIHAKKYLTALKKEIRIKARYIHSNTQVNHIHFGGGTPTYLSNEQLADLIKTLESEFEFLTPELECAIEIHPQTVDSDRLSELRKIGFNRLSIGVQDFTPCVQKAVNRYNSKEEVEKLVRQARKLGFKSCSLDLMYGLPLQNRASFSQTLTDVIALSPDRLSIFNYAHMPELFKSQKQINAKDLPEPEEKLKMLHDTIHTLTQNGYAYIGMDHFAKRGDELEQAQKRGRLHRNFQGYTNHENEIVQAFGASAISTVRHHYCQNTKQLDEYYRLLDQDRLPIQKGYILNLDDEIRRYVINALICQSKLEFTALRKHFDVAFFDYFEDLNSDLAALAKDGLITISSKAISIPPKGRLLARSVCKVFDSYLDSEEKVSNRYSRII